MGAWPVLTADQLDLTIDTWDFQQTLSDELGDLGTRLDGFDVYLQETLFLIGAGGVLSGSLGDSIDLAAGIAGTIDPNSLAGDVASFPASLAEGDAIVADSNALLGAVGPAPPATGGGGGGGGTNPTPTQSSACGSYGQSSLLLSDNTYNCDAADVLPVVNIADGSCTFIFPMDNSTFAGRATVSATSLQSGDAQLWSIANDTIPGVSGGAPVSRVWFTLKPYKTGHFLARFNVTTDRKATPETWCMIVDVISQGAPAGGGGTGGGAPGGRPVGSPVPKTF